MTFGLAEKLSLFVTLLILCTSIIIGGVFYYNAGNYMVDKELDSFADLLLKEEQRITGIIHEPREDVLFLSDLPPIQGIIRSRLEGGYDSIESSTEEQWKKRLESIFTSLITAKQDYLQIRFIGVADGGREIVRVEQNANKKIKVVRGNNFQKKGDSLYFSESIQLRDNKIYLSEIELNREYGKVFEPHTPVLRIAKPVFDQGGNVFGVVVINMDVSLLFSERINQQLLNRNNYYLVNDSGDFLTHPDKTKTFGFDLEKRYLIQQVFPVLGEILTSNSSNATNGIRVINNNDIIYFHKVFYDKNKPDKFIGLVYEESFGSIVSNVTELLKKGILWSLLFILIAVTFSFLAARFQLKKLSKVTQAIEGFSKGDRDFTFPDEQPDEVGVLMRAFKNMVHDYDIHEKALKESEVRFRTIINNVNDGIIIIDEIGVIRNINPATEVLFGYDSHELIEKNVNILMPSPHHEKHDSYISNYISTGIGKVISIGREVVGRRKDGTEFTADVEISEFSIDGQRLFTGVIRDISERKVAEQKLLDYQEHLQDMVNEQTHDLIEARDDAQAAERAMSGFLANMSHELRTPLHGIMSFSNFGLKKMGSVPEKKLKQYFSEIHDSGEHLLELVNDLLDLSKLRAGKMNYEYDDVQPAKIINQVIHEFETISHEKEINIILNDTSNSRSMMLDQTKFAQVIRNLISNAVKFSPSGSTIDLYSEYINASVMYEVKVCNHGVAIPEGEEESIFEPFFQSSNTKSGAGGTGLGLPICREIISVAHKGRIKAGTSKEGVTCFEILIPVQ